MKTNESRVRVEVLHRLGLDVRRLELLARAQVALEHGAVSRFFIFVRVNAAPLPGLTNWNSTTV